LKPFHDLTHVGQARRLRPHAVRVLAAFGLKPTSLRQLTAASNIIFRVDSENGRRFVLRMTSPKSAHSIENVRSEMAWVCALFRDPDIIVPEPIPMPGGEFVLPLDAPNLPGAWHCTLQRLLPGEPLSERCTLENVALQGSLSARLHTHGEQFALPEGFHIRSYRTPFPYSDPTFANPEPIMLFDRCSEKLMPPDRLDVFRLAHDRIQEVIDRLFETRTPHVIHNDLHFWNVLIHRGRPAALDFEDLLCGHPIQDLATTLYYYRHNERYEELLSAFREGYEGIRPWPEDREGSLEALIAARGIMLANYVAASQDAAERSIAPEYLARVEERLRDFLERHG